MISSNIKSAFEVDKLNSILSQPAVTTGTGIQKRKIKII